MKRYMKMAEAMTMDRVSGPSDFIDALSRCRRPARLTT